MKGPELTPTRAMFEALGKLYRQGRLLLNDADLIMGEHGWETKTNVVFEGISYSLGSPDKWFVHWAGRFYLPTKTKEEEPMVQRIPFISVHFAPDEDTKLDEPVASAGWLNYVAPMHLKEAKKRKVDHLATIEKAEQEIARLQAQVKARCFGPGDAEVLRQELEALRDHNLKEAPFEDKVNLVAMLGIKVYPSEDLRSRRIVCRLNIQKTAGEREQGDLAKVVFGESSWIRTLADSTTSHLVAAGQNARIPDRLSPLHGRPRPSLGPFLAAGSKGYHKSKGEGVIVFGIPRSLSPRGRRVARRPSAEGDKVPLREARG